MSRGGGCAHADWEDNWWERPSGIGRWRAPMHVGIVSCQGGGIFSLHNILQQEWVALTQIIFTTKNVFICFVVLLVVLLGICCRVWMPLVTSGMLVTLESRHYTAPHVSVTWLVIWRWPRTRHGRSPVMTGQWGSLHMEADCPLVFTGRRPARGIMLYVFYSH